MTCLDANILIEIIDKRSKQGLCRHYINSTSGLATTMLSVDLVMYYANKHKIDLSFTKGFLRQFIWLPLVEADGVWAFDNCQGSDFEDALQVACANREGCRSFATLDKALAKRYKDVIPVKLLA